MGFTGDISPRNQWKKFSPFWNNWWVRAYFARSFILLVGSKADLKVHHRQWITEIFLRLLDRNKTYSSNMIQSKRHHPPTKQTNPSHLCRLNPSYLYIYIYKALGVSMELAWEHRCSSLLASWAAKDRLWWEANEQIQHGKRLRPHRERTAAFLERLLIPRQCVVASFFSTEEFESVVETRASSRVPTPLATIDVPPAAVFAVPLAVT